MKTWIATTILVLGSGLRATHAQEISIPHDAQAKQSKVPETVTYAILFHQAAAFKDKADEMDRKGGDGSPLRRHMQAQFGLTPEQLLRLNSIAIRYREEVKDAESKVGESMERFREKNGQLPRGSRTLPPPSEASTLLANRDAVILLARDRFHSAVGDQEFARLDMAVKARISQNVIHDRTVADGGHK